MSEYQYEENVDEEGIRTILSLGEDYSGLKDDDTLLAEDEFKLRKSEMDDDYSLKCMDDYLLCDEDYSQCIRGEDDLSSSPEDVKDDINDEDLNDSGINLVSIFKTSLYIFIFQDKKCRLMRNLSLSMFLTYPV